MLLFLTLSVIVGCTSNEKDIEVERPADFDVSPGVETVTVLNATPYTPLTLYGADDEPIVTLISDDDGTAHFAYVGAEHVTLDPNDS